MRTIFETGFRPARMGQFDWGSLLSTGLQTGFQFYQQKRAVDRAKQERERAERLAREYEARAAEAEQQAEEAARAQVEAEVTASAEAPGTLTWVLVGGGVLAALVTTILLLKK